jgi:hypothetical protein
VLCPEKRVFENASIRETDDEERCASPSIRIADGPDPHNALAEILLTV